MTKSFEHSFGPIKAFRYGSNLFGEPKMFVYQFLIDGLLIDTAHSRSSGHVIKRLQNQEINQIFVSHHHEDHSGNIPILQNQFDAPIITNARCAAIMKNPPKISLAQWMTWGPRSAFENFEIENNNIVTPNYTFELIHLPGHASDMFGLFERKQGWLFSADLYVHHYIKYFMRPESMLGQINSIKKVLTLDFEWLLCSHNPQTKNPHQLLRKKLQFFEEFYGQVKELHQKGLDAKQIFKEMNLKESWSIRILSHGNLSTLNMVKSAIRDLGEFEDVPN